MAPNWEEIRQTVYSVCAWIFAALLLWASVGLANRLIVPGMAAAEAFKIWAGAIGIPAFVGVAFYGRVSTELVGVSIGLIFGFAFGSLIH